MVMQMQETRLTKMAKIDTGEMSEEEYWEIQAAADIYERIEGKNAKPDGSNGAG